MFDLAANKTDPLSRQKILAKGSLTKLAFNNHHPVLLVGDDRYVVDDLCQLSAVTSWKIACSEGAFVWSTEQGRPPCSPLLDVQGRMSIFDKGAMHSCIEVMGGLP